MRTCLSHILAHILHVCPFQLQEWKNVILIWSGTNVENIVPLPKKYWNVFKLKLESFNAKTFVFSTVKYFWFHLFVSYFWFMKMFLCSSFFSPFSFVFKFQEYLKVTPHAPLTCEHVQIAFVMQWKVKIGQYVPKTAQVRSRCFAFFKHLQM